MVQLALRHGVDVYLRPFGALLTETPVVHAQRDWVDIGYVYPPGALLVFAPLVPLARAGLPDSVFVRLCLAWVLLLTHLAIYACWSALAKSPPHPVRWLAGLACWMLLLHSGLCGQFDVVWVGAAALAIRAFIELRHAHSLCWIGTAALLHQRAFVLAPLAVVLLCRLLWDPPAMQVRRVGEWPWPALAFSGSTIGVALAATGVAMRWVDLNRNSPALIQDLGDPSAITAIVFTGALVACCVWQRSWALAASVLIVGGVALTDSRHWWHAAIVLPPLLLAGVLGHPARPTLLRVAMLAWAIVLTSVFGEKPLALFTALYTFLRS